MYFRIENPNDPSLATELIENPQYQDDLEHLFSSSPNLKKGCFIEVFNNSLVIKNYFTKSSPGHPPKRVSADIRTFSDNSRRRFVKKMAKINLQKYGKPLFVTLTYQNVYPTESQKLQQQLNLFLTKLRNDNLKYHYVWRLEFQKRGAPHFHIILFPLRNTDPNKLFIYKNKILLHWKSTIKDWSESMQLFSVDVQMLNGKKNVFQYISKYATKKDDNTEMNYRGRRYGFSNNLFLEPLLKAEIKLSDFDLLRKIIYNYMKQRGTLEEHFEKYLIHDPTVEVLMSLNEVNVILQKFKRYSASSTLDMFLIDFNQLDFDA